MQMQMLCNVIPNLSLQGSFEQFSVFKKTNVFFFVFFFIINLPYMGMTVNEAFTIYEHDSQ